MGILNLTDGCYVELRSGVVLGPIIVESNPEPRNRRRPIRYDLRRWCADGLHFDDGTPSPSDIVEVITGDRLERIARGVVLPEERAPGSTAPFSNTDEYLKAVGLGWPTPTLYRGIDKLQPALKNFLDAIYPDAPLRAVEFHSDHKLTADYGKPRNHAATVSIEIGVQGKLPTWIDENESAPGSDAFPKTEGGQSDLKPIGYIKPEDVEQLRLGIDCQPIHKDDQWGYSVPVFVESPSPSTQMVGDESCPTCGGTGKEGRHSICRDCDETTQVGGWLPISTMPRVEGLIVEVRQEKIERWNAMRFLRHHGDEGWSWRPVASAEVEG